jgi:hypothetical protein
MDWRNLSFAAVAYAAISEIVHVFGAAIDMPYYADQANQGLWSKVMMPSGGAPGLSFFLLSVIIALISGFIFAAAYTVLKASFRQKSYIDRGLSFGIVLFILVGVTGALSMSLTFAVPAGLGLSWMLQGLVTSLAGSIAFAKLL